MKKPGQKVLAYEVIRSLAANGCAMSIDDLLTKIGPSIAPELAIRRMSSRSKRPGGKIDMATALPKGRFRVLADYIWSMNKYRQVKTENNMVYLTEKGLFDMPELSIGFIKNKTILACFQAILARMEENNEGNRIGMRESLRVLIRVDMDEQKTLNMTETQQ